MEGGPVDVVWQMCDSFNPTTKGPAVIEQDDECVLERATSVFVELADYLLDVLKVQGQTG